MRCTRPTKIFALILVAVALLTNACNLAKPMPGSSAQSGDPRLRAAAIAQISKTPWCRIDGDTAGGDTYYDRTGSWLTFTADGKIRFGRLGLFYPTQQLRAYPEATDNVVDYAKMSWTLGFSPTVVAGMMNVVLIQDQAKIVDLITSDSAAVNFTAQSEIPDAAISVTVPGGAQYVYFPCESYSKDYALSLARIYDPIDLAASRGLDSEEKLTGGPANSLLRMMALVSPIVSLPAASALDGTNWCTWSIDTPRGVIGDPGDNPAVKMRLFILTISGMQVLHRGYTYQSNPPSVPGQIEPLAEYTYPANDIGFTLPTENVGPGDKRLEEYQVVTVKTAADGEVKSEGVSPDFALVQDAAGTKALVRMSSADTNQAADYNYFDCNDPRPAQLMGKAWISSDILNQVIAKQRAQFSH